MREIGIENAILLALMSPDRNEAATSEFLRFVIVEADQPSERHVTDPRAWTVQERMRAYSHYLAAVSADDDANFQIGNGRYSDYLLPAREYPREDVLELGEIDELTWTMRPLLGAEAEAIESIQHESKIGGRFYWYCGAMAAQLRNNNDGECPSAITNWTEYVEWLRPRMAQIRAMAESEYIALLEAWSNGNSQLDHYFSIDFDGNGALAVPVSEAGTTLGPVRFRARSVCSAIALRLAGKT